MTYPTTVSTPDHWAESRPGEVIRIVDPNGRLIESFTITGPPAKRGKRVAYNAERRYHPPTGNKNHLVTHTASRPDTLAAST